MALDSAWPVSQQARGVSVDPAPLHLISLPTSELSGQNPERGAVGFTLGATAPVREDMSPASPFRFPAIPYCCHRTTWGLRHQRPEKLLLKKKRVDKVHFHPPTLNGRAPLLIPGLERGLRPPQRPGRASGHTRSTAQAWEATAHSAGTFLRGLPALVHSPSPQGRSHTSCPGVTAASGMGDGVGHPCSIVPRTGPRPLL